MKLRFLEEKDAPLMLEWMHDINVVSHLSANFMSKTMEDCISFIQNSRTTQTDIHMAVADTESDEYMGTVSLKHIDRECAEFAITVRAAAMGKGYAAYAMNAILLHGLQESQTFLC